MIAIQNEYYYQPQWRTEFAYDGGSRLRQRSEYVWDEELMELVLVGETRYLYDGWRVIYPVR